MKKFYLFRFLLIFTCFTGSFAECLQAQTITPFTIWQQVTQRGDVTFAANTMLTCNGGAACNTAQTAVSPTGSGGGNNFSNNGFTMIYTNIADATDPVTRFSRSNASLSLGPTGGCGVIYAELFWGGNISTATANYAKRDSVYFKSPVGGYVGLKADIKTDATIPFTGYYCYKDVTNLVRAGGPGIYWLANEVLQNNATNLCGGWTLVVIYNDQTLPLRNLTIFRGISSIGATTPQNISITGFFTPPSPAAVNLKLGVYSLEGDRGTTGDSLKFRGNPAFGFLSVSNTKNQVDNAFNSTFNKDLAEVTRSPNFPNTLGIDGDIFTPVNTTYNYLLNSASSATLRMTSSSDVYAPFMLSTSIDVFEPLIEISKSVTDLNGGLAELGDTLKFTLTVTNKGTDPATNVILHDSLYGTMNYVPGSIKILTGANSGNKTDMAGDDQAEFANLAGVNFVKIRLGATANTTTGGNMGITAATDSITTMEFKATVTPDCQQFHCSNVSVVNKAYTTFAGKISGAGRSTYSSPTGFDAFGCPALGPTTLVVNVPVCLPPADTTITECSPYPLSKIVTRYPGYTQYYDNAWAPVTNVTSSGTYYAIRQLYPGCNDTIEVNVEIVCAVPQLSVTGNVFNDVNGNAIMDGTEPFTNAGSIYANLVDAAGLVITSVLVNASTGMYTFYSAVASATYKIILTATSQEPGVTLTASTLPTSPSGNWTNTGTNINGTANTANTTGIINLTTPASGSVTAQNFAIEQLPVATSTVMPFQQNSGYSIPVPAGQFTGTDSDGTAVSITITAFPSNAQSITINGVKYVSASAFNTAFPTGAVIPVDGSGHPTLAILVQPLPGGTISIVIPYITTDNAGKPSPGATVTVPFSAILPLTGLQLQASAAANCGMALSWQTLTEVNTSYFAIEYNTNGANNWQVLAVATAKGKSVGPQFYQYQHALPVKGANNYYRIKAFSKDGSFTYSSTVQQTGTCNGRPNITAYPNPVHKMLTIKGAESGSTIILLDAMGKILQQRPATGSGTDLMLTGHIITGMYLLKVTAADGSSTTLKLTKQ